MGLTAHVVNLFIMRHCRYPLHPPPLVRTAAFTGIVRDKGGTAPHTRLFGGEAGFPTGV
jgi:hypothetical protein